MTITCTWRSFLKIILNTLLLILTYQFWLTVLEANPEIDLAACLERIILFSESHGKDSIEQKDPDEVHGTRSEFQKKSNRQASVDRRRMSRVSMRLNFLHWPYVFIQILAGCVGIPSLAYSAPFLHYVTTLDGTITYFLETLCSALFWISPQPLQFLELEFLFHVA